MYFILVLSLLLASLHEAGASSSAAKLKEARRLQKQRLKDEQRVRQQLALSMITGAVASGAAVHALDGRALHVTLASVSGAMSSCSRNEMVPENAVPGGRLRVIGHLLRNKQMMSLLCGVADSSALMVMNNAISAQLPMLLALAEDMEGGEVSRVISLLTQLTTRTLLPIVLASGVCEAPAPAIIYVALATPSRVRILSFFAGIFAFNMLQIMTSWFLLCASPLLAMDVQQVPVQQQKLLVFAAPIYILALQFICRLMSVFFVNAFAYGRTIGYYRSALRNAYNRQEAGWASVLFLIFTSLIPFVLPSLMWCVVFFAVLPNVWSLAQWSLTSQAQAAVEWARKLLKLPDTGATSILTESEIKKAYRAMSKQAHPDIGSGGSRDLQAKLNLAKETLLKHARGDFQQ